MRSSDAHSAAPSRPSRLLFAALALCLAALGFAPAALAQNTCVVCHANQRDPRLHDPVERVRASVHASDAIGCVGCHGGRANEPTVNAHDLAQGFSARPDATTIAERCGSCHADARFVRRARADLPTDQLALFHNDAHGRALAAGNASAPSCVSCHGSHDVRPVSDPASPVSPRRLDETCGRCHADRARMGDSRLPTHQQSQWRASVHGRALLERSNARAPSCASCHGAHGEFREAGGPEAQCQHCHEDEAAAFARSPHAAAYHRLGFSGCVECHGSHDVREAASTLGDTGGMGVCRRCHAEGQRSFDVARRIATHADTAHREVERALSATRALAETGLRVPAADQLVDEAQRAEVRLQVALHTLDESVARDAVTAVREPARRAARLAGDARARQSRQRRGWLLAVPLLALYAALAWRKVRSLERAGGHAA